MNSIKFIPAIFAIGRVGKLLFCILFIIGAIVFASTKKNKIKFQLRKEWIIILILLMSFEAYFELANSSEINLLANLAFPIYFVFYYFIVKLFIQVYRTQFDIDMASLTKYRILSVFRKTLVINFIFWFIIALISGINMFETDGGFGGFFQDEIHFGFFVVTGFLISLYFRFNEIIRDRSFFNTFLLVIYGSVAFITSRNAVLIIAVALIYYFIVSKVKNQFYKVFLFTTVFIVANISMILQNFSEKEVIQVTSGRITLWTFAFEQMIKDGYLLLGKGLFNLNDIVLESHKGIGVYYLDSLTSLSFHNSYIELLAGGGIIVLLFFFRFLIKSWKTLTRIDRTIVISILVGANFESFLVQPFMLISCLFYSILICNSTVLKIRVKKVSDESIPNKTLLPFNNLGNILTKI